MLSLARVLGALIISMVLTNIVAAGPADEGKIPITTSSVEARQLYLQGRDFMQKYNAAEARAHFEQAVAKDPNFALAYRDLALVQSSYKELREYMARAVALVDKVSECERYSILAVEADLDLNYPKERDYLGQLVEKCGQDEYARLALGTFFSSRQYYDSSAVELQKAVELAPTFVPAWNMLGYARRDRGDYAGAEQAFLKYIELSPQDPNSYDSYAELLLRQGRYEESITRYRQALATDTTFLVSYYSIAAPLVYLGKYDEARGELQKLLSRARDDGERQTAYFGIAMTYLDEGKYDDAVAALNQGDALAAKINDINQMSQDAANVGLLKLEQGRYDEALAQYERSVQLLRGSNLAPTLTAAAERNLLYAKARVALKRGDIAQAKALADSFAVKATASGSVGEMRAMHGLKGIVALDEKQNNKAVEELKQSNLQSGYFKYWLALAYDGLGDRPKAMEQMTSAAHINSVLNLNDLLMRQKAKQLVEQWARK